VPSLSWDEVRARRLSRSHLRERAPADRLVEVVGDVCGVHAQVMGSAELQLSARVEGITQADVRAALWERRSLAKTWTLRGTLHIHPAGELRLWTAARSAVVGAADREADSLADVEAVVEAIGDALRGRCLLREELAEAVVARVGERPREQLNSGWGYFLGDAAIADRLCFGPPQGQKVTFVHPEDWLGPLQIWAPPDALKEVARRYAETYGPVGYRQFREWFGSRSLTASDAQSFFDSLDVAEPELPSPAPLSVRLLPEYDVCVMAFREREHLVPPAVREQVAAHGKGRYEGPAGVPLLVVDGVAAGVWKRRRTTKRIDISVAPARKLTHAEREGIDVEAERIGAFYGLEPGLEIA